MKRYIEDHVAGRSASVSVLHIAPDLGLYLWMRSLPDFTYVGADLDGTRYRHIPGIVEADITSLPFPTRSFDLVICSHVLEHVPDDRTAMLEIQRVLKPNGTAMLMVPEACDGLPTDEDSSVDGDSAREMRFGQWDHVRLYARGDLGNRLTGLGFSVDVVVDEEALDGGLETESLYLAHREDQDRSPIQKH